MYLTIAFRNLRQGGKRTWILGVALMGVSGLLTLLLCLTNGLNDSIIRAAETISAGCQCRRLKFPNRGIPSSLTLKP